MRIISIAVGRPRDVESHGRVVRTSIFKEPVIGPVRVHHLNLEGDEQSDLTVHGGVRKAVYTYPSEHYAPWRAELGEAVMPWGMFGENLTLEGLMEDDVFIGDRYRIGSAEFAVTQPRQPCYKLNLRFGRPDMVRRFFKSGRSGFYLSVVREGEIVAGDPITLLSREDDAPSVADVFATLAE